MKAGIVCSPEDYLYSSAGIYTMQDKILRKTTLEDRNMIDMSFAPAGMYVVIISNKGPRSYFRIIKE